MGNLRWGIYIVRNSENNFPMFSPLNLPSPHRGEGTQMQLFLPRSLEPPRMSGLWPRQHRPAETAHAKRLRDLRTQLRR